jgi:hypothetical protein
MVSKSLVEKRYAGPVRLFGSSCFMRSLRFFQASLIFRLVSSETLPCLLPATLFNAAIASLVPFSLV